MKRHYVYRLDDPITNEFYIGSRSCNYNPENDNYMGSYQTWKPTNKSRLKKTILKSNFENREIAIGYETKLIKENINDELNRNYHIPAESFHTSGTNLSKKHRKKISNTRIDKKIAKGKNNGMHGKHHTLKAINLQKQKATGRYTIEWFITKYGNERGIYLYNKKANDASNRTKGKLNPMYDKHHTDITKNSISELNSKKVNQYDLNGILIKQWNSLTEASNSTGISISTISACCDPNRINKTGKGFFWKLT